MNLESITSENFQQNVLDSNVPVLVEFGASWCGPCKKQLPILEKIAANNIETLKVFKIDIDDARDIASKYQIRSVPTMILFKNGKQMGLRVGLATEEKLKELINL